MIEPEQIDQALSEFFRAEAPKKWPSPPIQSMPNVLAARISDPLAGGRVALVASVLALVIASWWLAGTKFSVFRSATFDETTATRPADMRLGK